MVAIDPQKFSTVFRVLSQVESLFATRDHRTEMAGMRAGVFLLLTLCACALMSESYGAGITQARQLNLPGSERISKRSLQELEQQRQMEEFVRFRRAAVQQANSDSDDMDTAATNVFVPNFHKRSRIAYQRFRRAAPENNDEVEEQEYNEPSLTGAHQRVARAAAQQADDLDTAANTVFLPHFRKRFRPQFLRN